MRILSTLRDNDRRHEMTKLALYGTLLVAAVCITLAAADHHESLKKHRGEKKAHSVLEGSDTWRKLHRSNKHSKERFHHHEKHNEKELKKIQKHAVLSVPRHEASLQGDTLVNRRAAHKRQHDPHSTDIHLQDLAHPNGGHAHPHHEKLTHANHRPSVKHERHNTSPPVRSGHQIHRPLPQFDREDIEDRRPVHIHTNSRARSALRYAKQSRRVHKDGKERKFKKAFEKKSQHSKPHYVW